MSVSYKVNKEKKVVVAMFDVDWEDLISEVLYKYHTVVDPWKTAKRVCNLYKVKVGVAKTHSNDVFDETEGKRIARKKLVDRFKRCEALALRELLKRERNIINHNHKTIEKEILKLYGR